MSFHFLIYKLVNTGVLAKSYYIDQQEIKKDCLCIFSFQNSAEEFSEIINAAGTAFIPGAFVGAVFEALLMREKEFYTD